MFAGFTHRPAVDLATKVAALLPDDLARVFFSDDGSTSVEVALKIAYQYWINVGEPRRRVLVGFDGGYHGDTLGAMSLGRGSQMFSPFRDLMCKVYVLPYPSTFDGDDATDEREAGALSAFEALLADRGQTVAALIIEPLLQGAGGMRICRPSFLQRLTALARKAGVLVIFDEVATGFGRTGTMFAMKQADVVPDLCLSKGLTAGYMPLALTVSARRCSRRSWPADRALPTAIPSRPTRSPAPSASPRSCSRRRRRCGASLISTSAIAPMLKELPRERRDAATADRLDPRFRRAKAAGGYQSAQSRALRDFYLANGLRPRPLGDRHLMPPYCITDDELTRAYAG